MPQLVEQSLEDFKTVFVLKIGQQTKKSTPKWRIGCLKNGCSDKYHLWYPPGTLLHLTLGYPLHLSMIRVPVVTLRY